jgi:hypothetical protein
MPDIFDQISPEPLQGAKPTPSKGLKFNDSSAAGAPQSEQPQQTLAQTPSTGDIFDKIAPNEDVFDQLQPDDSHYRQLYHQQKAQGLGDVAHGAWEGAKALGNMVVGSAKELGQQYGDIEASAEQNPLAFQQSEGARRLRATMLEGASQTGRNYLNMVTKDAPNAEDIASAAPGGLSPATLMGAQLHHEINKPGGMVRNLLKKAGIINPTPEQEEAEYQAWKRAQQDKEELAKTPAAPAALQNLVSGGAEPLPNLTSAVSMVADPLNYLSLGAAPAAQTLRKVEAGINTATAAEKAAQMAGNVMKTTGHVLEKTGELPETIAQKVTESALGPQAAEAAGKFVSGAKVASVPLAFIHGGTPEVISAALEGAERAGKALHGVGEVTTALAEADRNNPFGRLAALAKDSDAPEWMRYAASSPLVKAAGAGAGAIKDVAAGAIHGAGVGAALGSANADTPEELGQSIGQMGGFGAGARALTLPSQNRARIMQKMSGAAAELYHQNVSEGVKPETLKKVGDSTMMNAAAAQKMFGDVKVRFLDGESGQYADQATKSDASPHSAGFWDRTSRTIYLNADSGRGADTTLLHELTHPLFDSVVANRPELKAQIDSALQRTGKTLDQAKRDYVEQVVGDKGFTDANDFNRAVDQYIGRMDKGSEATNNDPNHWIYSELMAEAGMKAMKGKNLVTDIADPSLSTRAVQATKGLLEGLGVKFKDGQNGKTILPNFEDAITSPELRKSTYSLLRAMKDYRPGIDAPEPQGVKVTPETLGQHPGAPVHVLPNGELGNDFMSQSASGKATARPNKDIRKIVRNRRAEVNAAYPLPQTEAPLTQDPRLQWRKTPSGLSERSGTTLGPDFDRLRTFNDDTKAKAHDLESAIANGEARQGWYQQIGEGADWHGSVSRDTGNISAQHKQFLPINFFIDKAGNALVRNYSLGAFNDKAQVWSGRHGPLSLDKWDGNVKEFKDDVTKYLDNHKQGLSGDTGIGEEKKNIINAFLVGKNVTWEKANPLRSTLRGSDTQGVVRSYRLDRLETLAPHETEFAKPDYSKQVKNLSPDEQRKVKEHPILHDMVEMWSRNGETAKSIADRLNYEGYTDSKGGAFTKESVKALRQSQGTRFQPETPAREYPKPEDRPAFEQAGGALERMRDTFAGHGIELPNLSPDTKKPTVMVKGPDGVEHPFWYDGSADWGKFGKFHQLTAQEDVPGLTIKHSSITDRTLEQKGFTWEPPKAEEAPKAPPAEPAKPSEVSQSPDDKYKLKTGPGSFSKAWILPDGKPVQLGKQWHHEWINENPDVVKKYGLKTTDSSEENRVDALRKGFVRVNYEKNTGTLKVEARQKDWANVKESVRKLVESNLGKIDNMDVHLLDARANKIVNQDGVKLFTYPAEEKMDNLPLISTPSDTTTMSAQASADMSPDVPHEEHIKWPAVRFTDEDGETWQYSAPRHAEAEQKLVDALGYTPQYDKVTDGFITYGGKFLDRQDSYKRAVATGQYVEKRGGSKEGLIAEQTRGMAPRDVSESPDVPREMPEEKVLSRYASRIAAMAEKKGGASFDVAAGKSPTKGFATSLYPDRTQLVKKGQLTPEVIKDFMQKNADLLAQPSHIMGTWNDKKSGKTYLDVSYVAPNENIAKHAAEMYNQKAYWDIKGQKEVAASGNGETMENMPPALERVSQAKASFAKTQELPKGEIRGPVQAALPKGTDNSKGRVRTVQESQHLDLEALKNAPDTEGYRKKAVEQFRTQPGFRDIDAKDTNKAIDEINNRIQHNLQFLYDRATPEDRALWKQWYDFAHSMSHRWGKEYGIHGDVVSAINARLSPQMEWNNNVTLTRRALDMIKKDPEVTQADLEFLKAKITKPDTEEEPQTTQSKNLMNRQLEALAGMKPGDKMSELNTLQAGMFMRSHNELYAARSPLHDHNLKEIPGDYLKWAKPFQDLADVVDIYRNPSFENVSDLLGGNHKVRSFYNNHVDPSSPLWTTIDTHATAAANLYPYGGSDKAVVSNFGNPNHKNSGINGVYPIYQDAYEKVAQKNGVLPRELQSIVWEQMRKELNPTAKRMVQDAAKKAAAKGATGPFEAIWAKAEKGEITREQAQKELTAEFEKWNARADHGAAARKRAGDEVAQNMQQELITSEQLDRMKREFDAAKKRGSEPLPPRAPPKPVEPNPTPKSYPRTRVVEEPF